MGASIAFETVGMLGSFVMSSALVPQMYKVYTTKSATDISLTFQTLYVTGVTMLLVYGLGEGLWPIYIPASLEVLTATTMLGLKLFYDRRMNKLVASGGTESPEIDVELGLVDLPAREDASEFREVRTPR